MTAERAPATATASLIANATTPKARRRRIEARAKIHSLAVAYTRVSTEEQALSGLGLAAQRAEVERLIERHGLTVVGWHEDAGVSGATIGKRPGLLAALEALDAGTAGVLVAKDATRLTRSLADLSALLQAADRDGWAVLTADGLINTRDPQGRLLPHFLGVVGELERRFTGQRTRQALAAAKARGVRLGKRSTLPAAVTDVIQQQRAEGRTWAAIAGHLNEADVPTGQGGSTWRPSSVRAAHLAAQRLVQQSGTSQQPKESHC